MLTPATDTSNQDIEESMELKNLWKKGQRLWASVIDECVEASNWNKLSVGEVLTFAKSKLLKEQHTDLTRLSREQKLTLLACRACITISPVLHASSTLAGSYIMATIVSVSEAQVHISYPSEPILAMAAQDVFIGTGSSTTELYHDVYSQLNESMLSGDVDEGHRGEVIVHLLNLAAMDKCVKESKVQSQNQLATTCIQLGSFLAKFNRKDLSVTDTLNGTLDKQTQLALIKKLRCLGVCDEGRRADDLPISPVPRSWGNDILEAKINFNHFVHLAKGTVITPHLIREAYLRGAAIVVNAAGRCGIDWLIPVYMGNNKFRALSGQDKNQAADLLLNRKKVDAAETYHKLTTGYETTLDQERVDFGS